MTETVLFSFKSLAQYRHIQLQDVKSQAKHQVDFETCEQKRKFSQIHLSLEIFCATKNQVD